MLHPLTRLKDNVVTAIKNARNAFNDPLNSVVQQKLREAFPGDPQTQEQVRQKIAANLSEAFAGASADQRDQRWFAPRNPMAGLAQSAMNVRPLRRASPSATDTGSGGGAGADPGCFPAFLMNTKANDDGDAVSGFALLKFDQETIDIGYINEDGRVFHNETRVANQPQ
ncbi:MAG TPA: hypothetical protein VIY49_13050 [Bryobacteraceae bacterium]